MTSRLLTCGRVLLALSLWQAQALQANAHNPTVKISKRDCQRLTLHQPAPDVAYQPGVDARGRPVAPADLGGAPRIALPEIITIDINVDLQDRFGFPANADSFEADASIGVVEIAPDGTAYFNGQPLQDEAEAELAKRCQDIMYGRPQP